MRTRNRSQRIVHRISSVTFSSAVDNSVLTPGMVAVEVSLNTLAVVWNVLGVVGFGVVGTAEDDGGRGSSTAVSSDPSLSASGESGSSWSDWDSCSISAFRRASAGSYSGLATVWVV